eukprot:scaffold1796_cov60-Cyclotella_meneghiniana.AAC.21
MQGSTEAGIISIRDSKVGVWSWLWMMNSNLNLAKPFNFNSETESSCSSSSSGDFRSSFTDSRGEYPPGEKDVQCRTGGQVVGKGPNGHDQTKVSDAPPEKMS